MNIEQIKKTLDFDKNYRIDSYQFYNGNILFNYDKKTTERVKPYFDLGLVKSLVNLKLVTPSFLNIDKNKTSKILQPEFVMPYKIIELTPELRIKAAKLILKLSLVLAKHNLMIAEGSLTRIFFNNHREPFFYDIAGIIKKKDFGFSYSSFCKIYLNYLRIISLKPHLANLLSSKVEIEFSDYISICFPIKFDLVKKCLSLLGKKEHEVKLSFLNNSPVMSLLEKFRFKILSHYFLKFFKREKNFQENISLLLTQDLLSELNSLSTFEIQQKWTGYYSEINFEKILKSNIDLKSSLKNKREQCIIKNISKKKYKSLLDVGANGGYFSIISGHVGLNTIAMDNDIGALQLLSKNLENNKSLPVLPIVKSFIEIPRTDLVRFKSDVVLALGFVHHMRLVELLSWEDIAERLFDLTNNILIIEFKSDTFARGQNDWRFDQAKNDYSEESLTKALTKFFSEVKKVGEFSALGSESKRLMYVCKR